MGKAQYEKLLRENITRHYSSANEDTFDEINAEAQVIASELGSANRVDVMAKREAFITLKDTKKISKTAYHADSSILQRARWVGEQTDS